MIWLLQIDLRCALRTGSLDVTDDGTGLVVHELDANLSDTTTRTYTPHHQSPALIVQVPSIALRGGGVVWAGKIVPVRPRTLVTLTSLTGALEESIVAVVMFCNSVGVRLQRVGWEKG